MNSASTRITKKLAVLTALSEGKRCKISSLVKLGGYKGEKELWKDLADLFYVGIPPFAPNDFFEVILSGDRIALMGPVGLLKNPVLTASEWDSIRKALQDLPWDKKKSGPLTQILAKIGTIIPVKDYIEKSIIKETINEAIRKSEKVRFTYKSPTKTSGKSGSGFTKKTAIPLFLFHKKEEYLAGFVEEKQLICSFRLDKMSSIQNLPGKVTLEALKLEAEKEKHLASFDTFVQQSEKIQKTAEVIYKESAAYHFEQIFRIAAKPETIQRNNTIWRKASVGIPEENWFIDQMKGFEEDAIVLSPQSLRSRILEDINSMKKAILAFSSKN